jgi:hypothetical protein
LTLQQRAQVVHAALREFGVGGFEAAMKKHRATENQIASTSNVSSLGPAFLARFVDGGGFSKAA